MSELSNRLVQEAEKAVDDGGFLDRYTIGDRPVREVFARDATVAVLRELAKITDALTVRMDEYFRPGYCFGIVPLSFVGRGCDGPGNPRRGDRSGCDATGCGCGPPSCVRGGGPLIRGCRRSSGLGPHLVRRVRLVLGGGQPPLPGVA